MAFSPVPTDDQCRDAFLASKEHSTLTEAAASIGVTVSQLKHRAKLYSERGLAGTKPVLPGFRISKTTAVTNQDGDVVREFIQQRPEAGASFEVPAGHVIKGVSALVDPDGRELAKWIKTKEGELDPLHVVELIKDAFKNYERTADPALAPSASSSELLTLIPLADWHVGMFAWRGETGENWDLKLSERTISAAMEDLIARSPSSGECIVLGGGDLIHSDSNANRTEKSGNVLQVDGRYDKVIQVASRMVAHTVDCALRRHKRVRLRILKGNHDKHASVAVAWHLLGWYRNDPRVTVDVDASLYWWHRFGSVLLGATHGDEAKIQDMPSIMAHRRAPDWGLTKFRYVHGFHLHHSAKFATEGGGVISEIHQAPIPQDAWHYGAGFLSGRSVQAITYHKDFGEIGRVRTAILDGEKVAA